MHGASVDPRVVWLGVRLTVLPPRRQVVRGVVSPYAAVVAAFGPPVVKYHLENVLCECRVKIFYWNMVHYQIIIDF